MNKLISLGLAIAATFLVSSTALAAHDCAELADMINSMTPIEGEHVECTGDDGDPNTQCQCTVVYDYCE